MEVFTRRIIGFAVERACVDGVSVCRIFNYAAARQPLPKRVSSDHDPLFRFHLWLAGSTPAQRAAAPTPVGAALACHAWRQICPGSFQTPIVG